MEEYTQAKCNVFRYQGPGDLLVLNADNSITASLAEKPGAGSGCSAEEKDPRTAASTIENSIL
jgi:UDP-N-acetylmuramoylalanine-D-glutamate ligase